MTALLAAETRTPLALSVYTSATNRCYRVEFHATADAKSFMERTDARDAELNAELAAELGVEKLFLSKWYHNYEPADMGEGWSDEALDELFPPAPPCPHGLSSDLCEDEVNHYMPDAVARAYGYNV